jgi:type I restriction enzyme S subunit
MMKDVKLGDVCNTSSGGTPRRGVQRYYGGTIPWAKIGDLETSSDGIVTETNEYITAEGLASINNRYFDAGTLLLAMYGSVGKTAFAGLRMSCNQAILGITPKDKDVIDLRYLKHWFVCNQERLVNGARGVALMNISASIVKNLEIPLPSLAEQQRIAAILDAADAHRQNTKALLEKYDQLAQSIFLDMFGDPVTNEKGWEVMKFRAAVKQISDGPFGSNLKSEHYRSAGVRVIRLNNVGVGKFVDGDMAYVDEAHYQNIKKYTCTKGDVLIATMGSPNVRACKFPDHISFAIHKADNVKVRPNEKFLIADFIVAMINSPSIQRMAELDMHGQTRTRVSMGQIAKWIVPIPPVDKQMEFSKAIQAVESQQKSLVHELNKSEALFQSLLQGAFTKSQ